MKERESISTFFELEWKEKSKYIIIDIEIESKGFYVQHFTINIDNDVLGMINSSSI